MGPHAISRNPICNYSKTLVLQTASGLISTFASLCDKQQTNVEIEKTTSHY
ncbi:hypothetical protein CEV33_1017 [Brucella grignonensis]|uniref:Uncharacterized protein n=1 Tax=Brucella grignonensis TaxID=94627 RepID=A0A256FEQ7_9HYPH|nr:hypothetical protein CEV33_1017 [Brucella grignonensis]